jgi:hypothetical protein
MKFLFARPNDWFIYSKKRHKSHYTKGWIGLYDVEHLFDTMVEVSKNLGVPCESRNIKPLTIVREPNTIYIGHHTQGIVKNTWHTKKGMVPDYLYFDKFGYSGWSELARKYEYDKILSIEEKQWVIDYITEYIKTNNSKIPQPTTAKIPNKPYILVLGQKPGDSVQQLAWIRTQALSKIVNEVYKDTEYEVYTKPHPGLAHIKFSGKRIEGAMHPLVANAKAVYTCNSGSGFESLFHMKHVFISGDCEYKWAGHAIKNKQDIIDTMPIIDTPVDEEKIIKFLHYCFKEFFVNCYDVDGITKKMQRCIDEYEV